MPKTLIELWKSVILVIELMIALLSLKRVLRRKRNDPACRHLNRVRHSFEPFEQLRQKATNIVISGAGLNGVFDYVVPCVAPAIRRVPGIDATRCSEILSDCYDRAKQRADSVSLMTHSPTIAACLFLRLLRHHVLVSLLQEPGMPADGTDGLVSQCGRFLAAFEMHETDFKRDVNTALRRAKPGVRRRLLPDTLGILAIGTTWIESDSALRIARCAARYLDERIQIWTNRAVGGSVAYELSRIVFIDTVVCELIQQARRAK